MAANSEAKPVRDWQETFPWLILFRSARISVGFRILLLAALGLVGMIAGWRLCWNFVAYAPDETGIQVIADPVLMQLSARRDGTLPPWPWETDAAGNEAYADYFGAGAFAEVNKTPFIGEIFGVAEATATELTFPFQMLFHKDLTYRGLAYALVCCGWALVIWGYFGAMITRIAAVKLTQDEMVSFKKAGKFARAKMLFIYVGAADSAPGYFWLRGTDRITWSGIKFWRRCLDCGRSLAPGYLPRFYDGDSGFGFSFRLATYVFNY